MQQTETYKLNLIEPKDKFLPDALNENAQKLEAALSESDTRLTAAAQGLDTRLKVFEAHQVATGQYGARSELSIDVGFKPKVVFVQALGTNLSDVLLDDNSSGQRAYGEITDTGFVLHRCDSSTSINYTGKRYWYVAFT